MRHEEQMVWELPFLSCIVTSGGWFVRHSGHCEQQWAKRRHQHLCEQQPRCLNLLRMSCDVKLAWLYAEGESCCCAGTSITNNNGGGTPVPSTPGQTPAPGTYNVVTVTTDCNGGASTQYSYVPGLMGIQRNVNNNCG